ncbi:MAG TPA: 3-hydroxy-5-phosphonooxypentane-2,4-dione thiolase, partial [Thermoplasmata archaeon]|nr:3-hydroxy-5-phosphonooxypentane-2,4-dione thiolase [Thermoplasmata archaeon]
TYYCDGFPKVVEGCPVPLVVAGGPKLDSDRAALELAYRAISEGARGIDMGRNIWQSDHPVPMLRALRAIVHDQATVAEAVAVLEESRARAVSPVVPPTARPPRRSRA